MNQNYLCNERTNAPIEGMGYPDYKFKSNGRSFVSHVEVRKFLESYASDFNLTSVIKFGHYVVRVAPAAPSQADQWEVKYFFHLKWEKNCSVGMDMSIFPLSGCS